MAKGADYVIANVAAAAALIVFACARVFWGLIAGLGSYLRALCDGVVRIEALREREAATLGGAKLEEPVGKGDLPPLETPPFVFRKSYVNSGWCSLFRVHQAKSQN